jgi:murein DD-endopeptidase MepM/ murein hydrolase activator NlpD
VAAGKAAARKAAAYLAGATGTPAAGAVVRVGAKVVGKVGARWLVLAALAVPALVCCCAGCFVVGTFGALGGGLPPELSACATAGPDPAACAGTPTVSVAGWTAPVPGPAGSGFRDRDCGAAGLPRCHAGVDIAAPKGTVVRAAAAGTVTLVTCNASLGGRPYSCDLDAPLDAAGVPLLTGCGWYVNITHPAGVVTRYCHMLSHPEVAVGQPVAAGQRIGLVGSSGNSSGPHLHFEVHVGGDLTDRGAVDPVGFLADRGVRLQ